MTLNKEGAFFTTVLCLAGFLFFFGLGERSFRNPDEGRYAQIAKTMVTSGDWVEPRLFGVDYLRKPVLFYWPVALFFKWFGFTEWAARAVPALFGVLGVAATFLFARRFLGFRPACYASLLLVSNFWYLQVGRYLLIDMVFAFFLMTALYSFYAAMHLESGRKIFYVLAYFSVACAFLAKGVVGFVLPAAGVGLYLLWTRQLWSRLRQMRLGWGLLLILGVASPWFIQIASKEPEFLYTFFFHEHIQRFLSHSYEHQEGWYYYWVLLPVILMPWPLLTEPFRRCFVSRIDKDERHLRAFLIASTMGLVVFYSLSRSKLLTYLLPCVPLLCILIGFGWDRWRREVVAGSRAGLRESSWVLGILALAGAAGVGMIHFFPGLFFKTGRTALAPHVQTIAAIVFAGSAAAFFATQRRSVDGIFVRLIGMMILVTFPVFGGINDMNQLYSTKVFAENLKPHLRAADRVFIYGQPGAFYDFGFYLDHPVQMVGLDGELELSKGDDEVQAASVSKDEFLRILREDPAYCLIRKSDFEELDEKVRARMQVIERDSRKVLFRSIPNPIRG